MLPIAWRRGALHSLGRHKAAICAFALVEFVIPFSLIFVGERWISSSVTGILIAMVPLSIALIQRFFGVHERLGVWRILGLALGFVGVASLLGFGTISGPLGWAGRRLHAGLHIGLCDRASDHSAPSGRARSLRPTRRQSAGGEPGAAASPPRWIFPRTCPRRSRWHRWPCSGVVCTAIAMLLMFYLVEHAGASRAAVITYINPAVAALLGVWLLHEHLGLGGILAFVLILLGSWLATRSGRVVRDAATPAAV